MNDFFLPPADSLLKSRLDDLVTATRLNDKTKIVSFSFSRKYLLNPVFSVSGQPIEVVKQTKLLGMILSDNCKWDANTKNIFKSGNSRLWFLRRLKTLGASVQTLFDIYTSLSVALCSSMELRSGQELSPKETFRILNVSSRMQ